MMEFLIVMAFIAIVMLLNYTPFFYHYMCFLYYDKKFHRELQALEDTEFFDKCRLVVTEPLGVGTEPSGKISFADAIKNQEFAMKSTMKLIDDMECV